MKRLPSSLLTAIFTLVPWQVFPAGEASVPPASSATMGHRPTPVQHPTAAQLHEAMKKLDWMMGKWEGTGWVDSATLGRREFS